MIYFSGMKEREVWYQKDGSSFLLKLKLYVPDKPGSLAKLARIFGNHKANIVYFYYNRSEHPNRVVVECKIHSKNNLNSLLHTLEEEKLFEEMFEEHLDIVELENVFKLSIYIEHVPGSLAKVADILKTYQANVIYMFFDEFISFNKAVIYFYLKYKELFSELMHHLNQQQYHYNIEYSGPDKDFINQLTGLNLIERFYLKLRKFLNEEEIAEIKKIIETSKFLSETLIKFNREAGKNLEAGEVFTNILTFALTSRTKTGSDFYYKRLPTFPVGSLLIHTFKPPTGGNLYVLEIGDELYMIDTTYGLYYNDVLKMLKENNLNPERIRKIFITHPDADHIGLAGYLERDFEVEVWIHKNAIPVIQNEHRIYGSNSPLYDLNKYFTILVNYFTKCKYPERYKTFNDKKIDEIFGFPMIDRFKIGEIEFQVLESLGGHVPGQVFFLSLEGGVIFTADYLLYVPSLTDEEKKILSIPKFLMTSTNANSKIFRREMELLTILCKNINLKLEGLKKGLMIFPGHGDYYPAKFLD